VVGKKIIEAKDKAKPTHRQSRQRVNKMKKPCGSVTRPNAAFGVRRCSWLSKEGSREECGSA
jgi:hypothetical protein